MTDLARLVVRLEAESLKFQKELDAAKRKLNGFEKSASTSARNVGKFFGAAAATAGTALAVMAKRAIDVADETSKAAQKIGTTTEALSQLRYAADLAGVSSSSLDKALLKLNRSMSETAVKGAGNAANAFKALGVEVENADGTMRASDAVLDDVADKFAGMQDGATKTALAMDLFGKSGAEMIPLLNGGSQALAEARREADALGQTIDGKAAKAAEQFNDNLSRLSKVLSGAMMQATQEVTPLLALFSDEVVKAAKDQELMQAFSATLATGLKLLASALIIVGGAFNAVATSVAGAAAAFNQLDVETVLRELTPMGQFLQAIGAIDSETEAARRAIDILAQSQADVTAATEKENALLDKLWGDLSANTEDAAATTTAATTEVEDALKGMGAAASAAASEQASAMQTILGMVQSLQQQTATYEQGEGAIIRYRIAQGDLAESFAKAGAGAEQYKQQIIDLTEKLEQQRKTTEATANHQQVFDDTLAQGRATYEATRTPLEQYESKIADLNSQLSVGAINQDTYNRAVAAAGASYDEARAKGDEWAKATEDAMKNAAQSIQSSLADFIFDPFADGLDGMLNGFVTMLRRMGAELLAAEVMKYLGNLSGLGGMTGGGVSGGGSNTGGIIAGLAGAIGGIFGGGGGGWMDAAGAIAARANGGPVTGGQPYLVGERGPELVVPSSSGNVLNARETAAMGNTQVNMTVVTPDADSFRKSRRQTANAIKMGVGV